MIPLHKYYCPKVQFTDDIANIARESRYYSQVALRCFAQTLEYLFALGYGGLRVTIYGLYEKIYADSVYDLTELFVSKELSRVYIIDDDNKYDIAKRCRKLYQKVQQSHSAHLRGIVLYYAGLVEEFDNNLISVDDMCSDSWMYHNYDCMELSAELGFSLAKKYLRHGNNFVTSQSAELCEFSHFLTD